MAENTGMYVYIEISIATLNSFQVSLIKKVNELWGNLRSYADRINIHIHAVAKDNMLHYIFDLSNTAYSDEFRNQVEELRRKAYDLGVTFSPIKVMPNEQAQKELSNV